MEKSVVLTIEDGVATIELARPEKLNAVNQAMADGLDEALQEIVAAKARTAVLSGRGKAFCAGADLGGRDANDAKTTELWINRIATLLDAMERLPCPLVAYVDGYALGLGASLAMAADLVLATESAQFGFPEVHHGLVPGLTMALLVDRTSTLDANRILYFGERFSAKQALDYGIVNEVVADAEGEATLADWVRRLGKGSPTALKLTKRLARQLRSLPTDSRYAAGIDAVLVGRKTDDAREGVAAFQEKRKPNWIR